MNAESQKMSAQQPRPLAEFRRLTRLNRTAVIVLVAILTATIGVLIKSSLFYRRIELCLNGDRQKFSIKFNPTEKRRRLGNYACVSLWPEVLADSKMGRAFGGAFAQVDEIWATSASKRSLRAISEIGTLNKIGFDEQTDFDETSCEQIGKNPLKVLLLRMTGIGDSPFRKLVHHHEMAELVILGEKNLTGEGLSSISFLNHLEYLYVSGLKGATEQDLIDAICGLKELQSLGIANTTIGDELAVCISGFPRLTDLKYFDSTITDRGVAALSNCKELEILIFRGGEFTIKGLRTLARLPRLKRLWVTEVPIAPDDVDDLRKLMPDCQVVITPVEEVISSAWEE